MTDVQVEGDVGTLRGPVDRRALREAVTRYAGGVATWRVEIGAGDRSGAAAWRAEGFVREAPGVLMTPAVALHARHLLGRVVEGRGVAVRLTEVEAYAGPDDLASHAWTRTPRSEIMYGAPGRLYVYRSYGLHLCANVVTGPDGLASAVLLRAGEVVAGVELARDRRRAVAEAPDVRLARGPGNLAAALGLVIDDNGTDLRGAGAVRLHPPAGDPPAPGAVVAGPRVGVSRAADVPWRFHLAGEPSVSAYRRSPRAP